MKKKIIVPKTVSRHVKEELRKNPKFRKTYYEERIKLHFICQCDT